MRRVDAREFVQIVTDLDNDIKSASADTSIEINTNADDTVNLQVVWQHEDLDTPFLLPHGIIVPAGNYNFARPGLSIETSPARPISTETTVSCCSFFNGRNLTIESNLTFRLSSYVFAEFRYDHTDLDLPGGEGVVRIGAATLNFNFTPDMQWANTIQYDNVSDNIGINSHFRWIVEPGTEFFLVVNQDFLAEDWHFRSQRSEAVIKFGHTFRL